MLKMAFVCLLAVALTTVADTKDKAEKVYPEHGKVISMRSELQTKGSGVYSDSEGRVYGGGVKTRRIAVFKLKRRGDLLFRDRIHNLFHPGI
jgi:hypothetical protein